MARSAAATRASTTRTPARRSARSRAIPASTRGVRGLQLPLSEEARASDFEYGYSACRDEALVLWEAQFGDFANGAQIIDRPAPRRPASSNGARRRGLTLLLPHGYEGQRSRALQRPAGTLPPARREREHPSELHHCRAVLPPAAAAGARPDRAAARRDDAEGAAAAEGVLVDARRSHRGQLPAGDRRSRRRSPLSSVRCRSWSSRC